MTDSTGMAGVTVRNEGPPKPHVHIDVGATSLAHTIRLRDAEVVFNPSVFMSEWFLQFGGYLFYPFIVMRHGFVGARNRSFDWGPLSFQMRIDVLHACGLALFWAFWRTSPGHSVTLAEFFIVQLLYLLRAAVIAGKYAHFNSATYLQLDRVLVSEKTITSKLVLVGWTEPSPELMMREMERAITRAAPHFARHRFIFPSEAERDAALRQMAACLPSYNELELGAPPSSPPPSSSAGGQKHPPPAVDVEAAMQTFYSLSHPSALTAMETSGMYAAAVPQFDGSIPCTCGSCAHCLIGGTPAASGTTGTTRGVDPAASWGPARLPALPAKLILWHILYLQYVLKPSGAPATIAFMSSAVLAVLPVVVRIALPDYSGAWYTQPVTLAVLLVHILSCFYLAFASIMFLFIGVFDLTRRLNSATEIERLLDVNHRGALHMHDDVGAGDVPAAPDDDADAGATPVPRANEITAVSSAVTPSGKVSGVLARLRALHSVGGPSGPPTPGAQTPVTHPNLRAAPAAASPPYGRPYGSLGAASESGSPGGLLEEASAPGTIDESLAGPLAWPRKHAPRGEGRNALGASAVQHGAVPDGAAPPMPPAMAAYRRGRSSLPEPCKPSEPVLHEQPDTTSPRHVRITVHSSQEFQWHPDGGSLGSKPQSGSDLRGTTAVAAGASSRGLRAGGNGSGAGFAAHMDLHPAHEDEHFERLLAFASASVAARNQGGRTGKRRRAKSEARDQRPHLMDRASRKARSARAALGGPAAPQPQSLSPRAAEATETFVKIVQGGWSGAGVEAEPGAGVEPEPATDERLSLLPAGQRRGSAAAHMPHMGEHARSEVVHRYALLSAAERAALLHQRSSQVVLPLLYPLNVNNWGTLRHTLHDIGREYSHRISFYCLMYLCVVVAGELALIVTVTFNPSRSLDFAMLVVLAGFFLLFFDAAICAQILQGARANVVTYSQQLRLNTIESLTHEYLLTAEARLPFAIRARLATTGRVVGSLNERLKILDFLEPTRVMFVPARFALFGAMASVTSSVLIVVLNALRTAF